MNDDLVPTNLTNDHTIGVLAERVRCLQLIDNLIERHKYHLRIRELLKDLRRKVKSGGTSGGRSRGQQEQPSSN